MLRILQAVAQVLDMSDPDHDTFVDSAADCLDALLAQQELLRTLLRNSGRTSAQWQPMMK
jgi:ABC-type transporter Mla subunit MlaD